METETITVNIRKDVAKRFRLAASHKYGAAKGHLGKAMTEALEKWMEKDNSEILEESILLLKNGIKMRRWNFNREELYER